MSHHPHLSGNRAGRARYTVTLAAAFIGTLAACSDDGAATASRTSAAVNAEANAEGHGGDAPRGLQERYLYVATIAQSTTDPDFIAVVGADPTKADYGQIVNRVDMPTVGDELHHFGYSMDQKRIIAPGLFSNRIHVLTVGSNTRDLAITAVNDLVTAKSGYATPHGVVATSGGRLSVPMIGAATEDTRPGGIVQINDVTGAFEGIYGPGPKREPGELAPKYMYDFAGRVEANRAISSTFGPPALCAPKIDPTCLGDEVAVWDIKAQKVVQVANLGTNSGALQVRFIEKTGVRRAFINAAGTNALWLADDDDNDGVFDFQQVLGPTDGLNLPADMLISYDFRTLYLTNFFGNTVQQYDIADPFHPRLVAQVTIPHPNMLRLSRDNRRLYVTNSLLSTWDNDPSLGPPRNTDYGIWLFDVNPATGSLSSVRTDRTPWVSFDHVQKQHTTGPAGPHMMLFDPSIKLRPGEH